MASLIKMGVEKNKEEIQKESFSLSSFNKEVLYEENRKKTALGWATLNVLPGFGVGSYIQGDIVFGFAQSILEVTAFTIISFSGTDYSPGCLDDDYKNLCSDEERRQAKKDKIIWNIGAGIFITSYITGLIRPFYYQSKQNKALKKALNINDDEDEKTVDYFSLSIDPLIVPRDGTPAVGLAFNVRY